MTWSFVTLGNPRRVALAGTAGSPLYNGEETEAQSMVTGPGSQSSLEAEPAA